MFQIFSLKNGLDNVKGFYSQGINAGLKKDKNDIAFIYSEEECDVSACFTSNIFQAAPIKHFKKYPKDFKTNFILINSKNANAMTGTKGIEDIEEILQNLNQYNPNIKNPIMSSTGVIGYRLPKQTIINSFKKFDFQKKDSNSAAQAIMTTDTFKKEIALEVKLENGKSFNIAAICKGAGMINPAMATMLCFIITDANIPKKDMDACLKDAVKDSFNTISVDGDTSTNDTVFLLSNKKSEVYDKNAFCEALRLLTKELSMQILKDGEGATKVVAFEVKNAKTYEDAKKAAFALSNSLLVKTALFGEDPNWGRIASTIGASQIKCDEEKLTIKYDNITVYGNGTKEMDKELEEKAYKVLKQDSFKISCDLNMGSQTYTAYGCDLSYKYVQINAEYRS